MDINPKLVTPLGPTSEEDFALERLVLTTQKDSFLDWVRKWAQKNSLCPLPFGTACCAMEYMAAQGPRYDLGRFGSEVVRFNPGQSDLMIIAGTVTEKMAPVLRKIYQQMAGPKWVIAMGACAASGGFYRSYHVVQGVSREIPVDVYIPGCPPTPEAVIEGIMKIGERIEKGVCASEGHIAAAELT
ncbi:MAG: NADH-quinone oxidoreductase subunit NuoB [Halobacteriovoraceae bacterium]|jgi:NADH-quinone oxidoreductase subunit B|nr:NADH-quinone oxidoreductase subunit NuoB [Halobacteriovoraceae bacterium]MBT5095686.1 NADH-quinone oxidoreductase subunit NuoB [Halobacteriovoraceae bacterium]